nr:PREDICTED: uncharacterized protein LOC109036116 isoform X2 [Bemisia tabaci]XP_018905615.1 PREDICTED: uncharacterized protein LOC109036116 isoform X2 [Bemisia tabaci]
MEGKSFDQETYLSYKRALDDPQFEFVDLLDYDDSAYGYLKDHHSFKPEDYLKLLISRAMIDSTTPVQFHKEMKEIIDLREEARPFNPFDLSYPDFSRFRQLADKYGVKIDIDEPGALITNDIIDFLFPHYYLEAIDRKEDHSNAESDKFREIMTYLEFAAIIPRGRILMETVRTAIVTMHICVLYEYQTGEEEIIPMPVLQKIVRHRINIGLLSDERRVRFLITKQFITPDLHLSFAFKKEYDKLQESSPELISLISERLM